MSSGVLAVFTALRLINKICPLFVLVPVQLASGIFSNDIAKIIFLLVYCLRTIPTLCNPPSGRFRVCLKMQNALLIDLTGYSGNFPAQLQLKFEVLVWIISRL